MSLAEKIHQEHLERRKRLFGVPKPKPKVEPPANMNWSPVFLAYVVTPLWKIHDLEFDSHVQVHKYHEFVRNYNPPLAFIKQRCIDLGITYEILCNNGKRRCMKICMKRHQIVWETKKKYPSLSYPALGRLMNGKNHATMMHSVQKIERLISEGWKPLESASDED